MEAEVAATAGGQRGVISIGQLAAAGVSRRAAAHRAEVDRLHRVHRGVYAVGHRAIDQEGRLLAAVHACGEGAVISHATAAALWGIREPFPVLIDVIVPCETGRKIDGIRAHRCRYPGPEEVTIHDGVPCTTLARTLVDVAGSFGRSTLRRSVETAAVLGRLDLPALDLALYEAKGRRGVRVLRAIADEWRTPEGETPDVRSLFEARAVPALLALGAAPPACNQALPVAGQIFVPDFLWPRERLIVETDGEATHGTPVAFRRDRRRDQILMAAGYGVTRLTWDDITNDLDATITRIHRMLSARGSFVTQSVDKEPHDGV